MPLDISNDLTTIDGLEPITFTSVTATAMNTGGKISTTSVDYSVAQALWRAVSSHEVAAGGGALRVGDRKCRIPKNQLSVEPKEADVITDQAGVKWRVLAYNIATLATAYLVFTRKP